MEGRKQPRAGDPQRKPETKSSGMEEQEHMVKVKKTEAICNFLTTFLIIITILVKQMNYNTKESLQQNAKKKLGALMNEYKKVQECKPVAFIELNIGNGKKETLPVYEGEKAVHVADKVAKKYGTLSTLRELIMNEK